MDAPKPPLICLIVLVHHYDEHLDKCLRSTVPFVNSWVLYDFTTAYKLPDKVKQILDHLPGQHLPRPFSGYAAARNTALSAAEKMADIALLLEPDEQLLVTRDDLALEPDSIIGILEVASRGFSEWMPRLLRLGKGLEYENIAAETIKNCLEHASQRLERVTIESNRQGTWRASCLNRDRSLISAQLSEQPQNQGLRLSLARLELRANNVEHAQSLLKIVASSETTIQTQWLSRYLLAIIEIATADKQTEGQQAPDYTSPMLRLQECIELAPDQPEPYMRLVLLLKNQGRLEDAVELNKLIVELGIAPNAEYFEPDLYRYIAKLELAELYFALDNIDAARATAKSVIEHASIPASALRKIKYLATAPQQTDLVARARTMRHSQQSIASDSATQEKPILTIGMATFDDFDGVYFSLMSILLYHPEVQEKIEILIVDNNPESEHGKSVKSLSKCAANVRYIAAGEFHGTTVRERVFAEARGDFVMCMDCHVFLHQGSIANLLAFCVAQENSLDLWHGPMFDENLHGFTTHMEPQWRAGFYGHYGTDQRAKELDAEPFEIPMQGLGLFVCRRLAWPGFSKKFRGFGGEEGYIHEKIRRAGGRVLCVPLLRWTHRFYRPNGTQYMNAWEDRIRNYLVGWSELGMNTNDVLEHFSQHVGQAITAATHASFKSEQRGPLWPFSSIYCLSEGAQHWSSLQSALQSLSIDRLTQEIRLADFGGDRNRALAHILSLAHTQKLDDVVIINIAENEQHDNFRQLCAENLKQTELKKFQCLALAGEQQTEMPSILLIKAGAYKSASSLLENKSELTMHNFHDSDMKVWPSVIDSQTDR